MTLLVDIFVGMMIAVVVLALLARRLHIPYPIFFVIGGTLIGFIPGLPQLHLAPELIFLFVLPPLLFPAALFTSWRDFRSRSTLPPRPPPRTAAPPSPTCCPPSRAASA